MKINNLKKQIFLFYLFTHIIILPNCSVTELTPAEVSQRQKLTFDISGEYVESGPETETPNRLIINNEVGFHNVEAKLMLNNFDLEPHFFKIGELFSTSDRPLSKDEVSLVIEALKPKLAATELGKYNTYTKRGGENIVLDAEGEASEMVLSSIPLALNSSVFSDQVQYKVVIHLMLTAYQNQNQLDTEETPNSDSPIFNIDQKKGAFIEVLKEDKSEETERSLGYFELPIHSFQKLTTKDTKETRDNESDS